MKIKKWKKMVMCIHKTIDLAWAAGFFEGEGCFYAHYYKPRHNGTKVYRTASSLSQKDEALLYKFKDIIGFGVVYLSSKGDISVWKTTRKGESEQLYDMLKPWLSKRRIETADRLIKKEKEQTFRPLSSTCIRGQEYTKENTIVRKNKSGRECKICRNQYMKDWRARQPKGYWKSIAHCRSN